MGQLLHRCARMTASVRTGEETGVRSIAELAVGPASLAGDYVG